MPWKRVPSSSQPAVHVQPRVHLSRTPHEWSRWPMASRAIDSPHQHLALHPTRHLVPGGAGTGRRRRRHPCPTRGRGRRAPARRRPPYISAGSSRPRANASQPRVMWSNGTSTVWSAHRPSPCSSSEPAAGGATVVDHGHERPALAHQAGPVPGGALVGVEADAHVAPQRAVGRGEVEVPRLVPPRLGTHGVVAPSAAVSPVGGAAVMGSMARPPAIACRACGT